MSPKNFSFHLRTIKPFGIAPAMVVHALDPAGKLPETFNLSVMFSGFHAPMGWSSTPQKCCPP